jgi:hypothetical protein
MSVGESQRLTVTCPNCGKIGKLPVGVTVYPKTMKCSGCQVKFNSSAALREEVVMDVVSVKKPEIYALEQPAAKPVKWTPTPLVSQSHSKSKSKVDRLDPVFRTSRVEYLRITAGLRYQIS